jgi:hypothetical protein
MPDIPSARGGGLAEERVDLRGVAEEPHSIAGPEGRVRRRIERDAIRTDDRHHGDAEVLADPRLAERLAGAALAGMATSGSPARVAAGCARAISPRQHGGGEGVGEIAEDEGSATMTQPSSLARRPGTA